jgi:hypothetical protein
VRTTGPSRRFSLSPNRVLPDAAPDPEDDVAADADGEEVSDAVTNTTAVDVVLEVDFEPAFKSAFPHFSWVMGHRHDLLDDSINVSTLSSVDVLSSSPVAVTVGYSEYSLMVASSDIYASVSMAIVSVKEGTSRTSDTVIPYSVNQSVT